MRVHTEKCSDGGEVQVVSLRPMEKSLGEIATELIKIGNSPGFLKPCKEDYAKGNCYAGRPFPKYAAAEFNRNSHNVRARELGEELNTLGGFRLMQQMHARIEDKIPDGQGRCLEFCWDGVGAWQG